MTKLELVETWYRRVWTDQDADAIDQIFVPEGVSHGLGNNPILGPNEFKVFHTALLAHLDKIKITILSHMENEDWITSFCTLDAVARWTEKPVHTSGVTVIRIANGKIQEGYDFWDFIGLFEQLGLLPPDTFATALFSPARRE